MDPFLLCVLIAAVVTRAPAAIADAYAARKAADAGEWGYLRERAAARDARAARRADWAERILARRRVKAEGKDPKRAGLGTLAADIYHGACEDALARRTAHRATRPAAAGRGHRRSRWDQVTDLLRDTVRRARAARRPAGRGEIADGAEPIRHDGPAPITEPAAEPAAVPDVEPAVRPVADQPEPIKPLFVDVDKPSSPTTDPTTEGEPMTAPTGTAGAATVGDVQTNEDARRALEQMREGAAELGEAAAMAEAAKAKIQAASQATGDAMSAKSFDKGATDAVNNINDIVSNDNLSAMSAAADEIESAASKGLKDLEKYRDSEDLVAAEKVDATTLASTSS